MLITIMKDAAPKKGYGNSEDKVSIIFGRSFNAWQVTQNVTDWHTHNCISKMGQPRNFLTHDEILDEYHEYWDTII